MWKYPNVGGKEIEYVFLEKPDLDNVILVEGLPGIGLVANISVQHMIKELDAKKFVKIVSYEFQNFVVISPDSTVLTPINDLYYVKGVAGHDLVLLYGNTQAVTSYGQYVLSSTILDIVEPYNPSLIITLGGYPVSMAPLRPKVYGAATDEELMYELQKLGVRRMYGVISGQAGLLPCMAKMRGWRGFCLLAETTGAYPDTNAAKAVLEILTRYLGIELNLKKLGEIAEATLRLVREKYEEDRVLFTPDMLERRESEGLGYI